MCRILFRNKINAEKRVIQMEIKTKVDTEDLKEIIHGISGFWNKFLLHVDAAAMILMGLTITVIDTWLRIGFVLIGIAIEVLSYYATKRTISNAVNRVKASTKDGVIHYIYQLKENEISVNDAETHAHMDYAYDAFAFYYETEHFQVYMMQNRAFIAFAKDAALQNNVKEWFLAKNPKIKHK